MKKKLNKSKRLSAVGAGILAATVALSGCTGTTAPAPTSTSTTAAPDGAIASLLEQGINQGNAGKYGDALATFNNVLVLDPGNKFAYFNIGVVAQSQGNDGDAVAAYGKALATDPHFTPALFNKAIILEASDRDQAASIYQQIVQIDPKAATAFLRLSFLLDAQGKSDDAKKARDTALDLDKSLADVPSPFAATEVPEPEPSPTPTN